MDLYIIGSGGHARVIAEAARLRDYDVRYIVPDAAEEPDTVKESEFFTQVSTLDDDWHLICGVGSIDSCERRRAIIERYRSYQDQFVSIVHPAACVAHSATLGPGSFVAQGAQVTSGARIGNHVIINTGAVVDHDCDIGHYCHIAPGATLSGGVRVGAGSHVGTGANIIQCVELAPGTVIGAGGLVVESISEAGQLWCGQPVTRRRSL